MHHPGEEEEEKKDDDDEIETKKSEKETAECIQALMKIAPFVFGNDQQEVSVKFLHAITRILSQLSNDSVAETLISTLESCVFNLVASDLQMSTGMT